MLQVVDEIDDAVGALRLASMGWAAELGVVVAGCVGIGAMGVAIAAGAEVSLICAASILLSLAGVLKLHGRQQQNRR